MRRAVNPLCRTGVGGIYQRRSRQFRICRLPAGSASAWRRDWIEWRCTGSAVRWSVPRCGEQRFEVEIEQIRTSRWLHLVALTASFLNQKAGLDRLISVSFQKLWSAGMRLGSESGCGGRSGVRPHHIPGLARAQRCGPSRPGFLIGRPNCEEGNAPRARVHRR